MSRIRAFAIQPGVPEGAKRVFEIVHSELEELEHKNRDLRTAVDVLRREVDSLKSRLPS